MTANRTLLWRKYGHVINAIAVRQGVDLKQAMDIFYKSHTYQEMRIGISDMHCRSDEYLVEEIAREHEEKTPLRKIPRLGALGILV